MTNEEPLPTIQINGDVTGQVGVGNVVMQTQETDSVEAQSPVTVLFWAANPIDTDPLRLDQEVRTIDDRLRQSEHRDRFDLRQQWAVRFTDLSEGLLRYEPKIVHFSGHGNPTGTLVFEDESGRGRPVETSALANLFQIVGGNVRCVVLNACHSAHQAQAVAEHVDCVVGTSSAIGDEAAIRFAAGFYRALGYGRSVGTAFALGRNEIDLAALADEDVPRLHVRTGVDAANVEFVQA